MMEFSSEADGAIWSATPTPFLANGERLPPDRCGIGAPGQSNHLSHGDPWDYDWGPVTGAGCPVPCTGESMCPGESRVRSPPAATGALG